MEYLSNKSRGGADNEGEGVSVCSSRERWQQQRGLSGNYLCIIDGTSVARAGIRQGLNQYRPSVDQPAVSFSRRRTSLLPQLT